MIDARRLGVTLLGACLLVGAGPRGAGQCATAKLVDGEPQAYGGTGGAVAIDGDTALVGKTYGSVDGVPCGAAYVFDGAQPGWPQQARLVAPAGVAGDHFGFAVALHGDVALVGAPGVGDDEGRAHVFRRVDGSWQHEAVLQAPDPRADDGFGRALALAPGLAVVGVPGDDAPAYGSGSAHVYRSDGDGGWPLVAVLRAPDVFPDTLFAHFGGSVAVDGAFVAVGSAGQGVLLFRDDGASLQPDGVIAPPPDGADHGTAVALHGTTLAVAGRDTLADETLVHVHTRRGPGDWRLQDTLPLTGLGVAFGRAWLDVDGDTLLCGTPHDGAAGLYAGAAHLYRRDGGAWSHAAKLVGPDSTAEDGFGVSVALHGARALIGAHRNSAGLHWTGAAYVFDLGAPAGDWAALGNGLGGSHGVPCLRGFGPLASSAIVSLELTHARADTTAALVLGLANDSAPFNVGVMVPAPDLLVLGVPTGPAGAVSVSGALGDVPLGTALYAQWWIVDDGAPAGLSASNAVTDTAL